MSRALLVDGVRTPIGRYAGALSSVRPDDLAALTLRRLAARTGIDPAEIDDVVLGNANQAGEDNRNVARMALLLAGFPETVSGTTVNRLCGSGADAVAIAARAINAGQADIVVAGGVESMSRAPFVIPKAASPFARSPEIFDTTIGWRFVNRALETAYGAESMGETAENIAAEFGITRADQDRFALSSQLRTAKAQADNRFDVELTAVEVPQRRGAPVVVDRDEHPRETDLEALARLRPAFRAGGTVTAGNAAGVNDGAAALLLMSERAVERTGLTPVAEVVSAATAGVLPRVMGLGPVPATRKLLDRTGVRIGDIDVMELNEAFAAQALAVLRQLGLPDDAEHVNPNGGAISLGHPLGMSGARLVLTAARELERRGARRAVVSMCIGVGQGISLLLERRP
ncbi:3-oxoadipyl-CoA thiolase [Dactylosporangium sp. CA-092794]|uniref:3-oxoadipyl-CoA thiolase n=1 Tax=Dactylosporangium sp. CA-092794 TaxID=3239929 RepID=UPI003D91D066